MKREQLRSSYEMRRAANFFMSGRIIFEAENAAHLRISVVCSDIKLTHVDNGEEQS